MKKPIDLYIRELSIKDKKSLTQKALKVCEETGELAKVILPYENAFATNHNFIDKDKILEAIVDVYLTAISIGHDIGFTDEEFEEKLKEKTFKWATLQKREMVIEGKIPYEIHVTVHGVDKESFKNTCENLSVKPIVLDLQNKDGKTVFEDVMTSSVFFGNNREAYDELQRIVIGLQKEGMNVVRQKIETIPWHPAAPSRESHKPMPKDCYFETHFALLASKDTLPDLTQLSKDLNCYLSRNIFKRVDNDNFKIMATYRSYKGNYEDFLESVNIIRARFEERFKVDKMIVEFSIYDTKVSHDSSWLTKN